MPTPLEKLQSDYKAHYSDMPFEQFVEKVHQKFYSDMPLSDLTDKLGLTVAPSINGPNGVAPQTETPMSPVEGASPWETGEVPPFREMASKTGIVRTPLEYGGMAAGGAAGAFGGTLLAPGLGTVAGGIAGETGGYAGGSKLADLLLGENTGSIQRKLGEGLLFSVVPRGVAAGLSKFGRGAIRSALKIPPTQANAKTAEGAVETIIKENLPVGQGGVAKAKEIVSAIENDMNAVLSNSGSKVNVADIVSTMEAQKARFANSSDPEFANKIIDTVIGKFLKHPNVENLQMAGAGGKIAPTAGEIPIEKAQLMKKELYRELDKFYKNLQGLTPNKAMASNVESIAKASEAEALRTQIMADPTMPAEAASWLKREANLMNALRWIERRANVAANMDPITFNDVLLGGLVKQGVPTAVATRILRMPSVMSRVGIAMAKTAPRAKTSLQLGGVATKNNLLYQD